MHSIVVDFVVEVVVVAVVVAVVVVVVVEAVVVVENWGLDQNYFAKFKSKHNNNQ